MHWGDGIVELGLMMGVCYRLGVYASVSPAHGHWNAKEWTDHITAAVGRGKGGGRADFANASIAIDSSVSLEAVTKQVLDAARLYVQKK